ncbi:MAG: hypothetical protein HY302_12845 [Opitutae bacterium]|nr:hypothetical protein [Opitutae bacterium]
MSGAIYAELIGIPLRYLDEVFMVIGVAAIVLGVWMRYRIVEIRMQAEEDVKSRKLSQEQADRRVRNRTILVHLIIVVGMALAVAAVGLLIVESEMNAGPGQ